VSAAVMSPGTTLATTQPPRASRRPATQHLTIGGPRLKWE
jgi:hypothetical protein